MSEAVAKARVRRRVGGPTLAIFVDFLGQARATRSWVILIAVILAVIAALAAVVSQTVVPWAIYPAL